MSGLNSCVSADCDSGTELVKDKTSCQNCPKKKYRKKGESVTCLDCPSGKTTKEEAAKSISECNIGKYTS